MLKDEVLKKLSENEYVSGEQLATAIGVSRNSVWKAVNKLRAEGYLIDSSTNRGYILLERPDSVTQENIEKYLYEKNFYKFIICDSVDSTNRAALDEAAKGASAGTVIIAESQSNGRGRLGRAFFSPRGSGIYMSVILRPKLDLNQLPLITACTGVAVSKAVDKVADVQSGIKWVNDVYLGGKKLCGILSQANIDMETGKAEAVVVGIGINTGKNAFSPGLSNIAVNIEDFTGVKISRSRLIAEVLNNMYDLESQIESGSFLDEYRKRSIVIGKKVMVHTVQSTYEATVTNINNNAELVVKLSDGTEKNLDSGEVSIRVY